MQMLKSGSGLSRDLNHGFGLEILVFCSLLI